MTQVCFITKSGTREVSTSRSQSQLQFMIKTQFFHFSNVVFPEFSKFIVKLSSVAQSDTSFLGRCQVDHYDDPDAFDKWKSDCF